MRQILPLVLGVLLVSLGCNLLFLARHNSQIIYVMENDIQGNYSKFEKESVRWEVLNLNKILINEPETCGSNATMALLTVVCSAVSYEQERNAIRRTWGDDLKQRPDSRLVFLLGKTKDVYLQGMVESESRRHHDIIQYDFIDSYRNLSLKSVAFLRWVRDFCPNVRFIMKTDDNVYVNVPNLIGMLMNLQPSPSEFIIGYVFHGARPVRNKHSKWMTTIKEFAQSKFPDYVSGFSYILTNGAANKLYFSALSTKFFWLEDVFITGICRIKTNVVLSHSPKMIFDRVKPTRCAYRDVIAAHNVSPRRMITVHKELHDNSAC